MPTIICVRNKEAAQGLDALLKSKDFLFEGVQMTKPTSILEFIESSQDYDFKRSRWGDQEYSRVASKQYIHRSGALFVRMIPDSTGLALLMVIENQRNASRENNFKAIARFILVDLQKTIEDNDKSEPKMVEEDEKVEAKMAEEDEKIKPQPQETSEKAELKMVEPKPAGEDDSIETKKVEENQELEPESVEEGKRVHPISPDENVKLEPESAEGTEKAGPKLISE